MSQPFANHFIGSDISLMEEIVRKNKVSSLDVNSASDVGILLHYFRFCAYSFFMSFAKIAMQYI